MIRTVFFPWFLCLLGAAFYCYEYLLRILPSVMVTDLMQFYHVGAASLGQLAAFYYYAYTPMQLPIGILMDKYSPRLMLGFACLACTIGSYFFIATSNFWVAAGGRFGVGLGSAFAFVGVLKLASIWLPPQRFAFVSGLTTMLGMIGGMIGTVWLSDMVHRLGWQFTNHLFIISGVMLSVLLIVFISTPTRETHQESLASKTSLPSCSVWQGFVQVLSNPQIWLNGAIGGCLYASLAVFAEMWGVTFLEQGCKYSTDVAVRAVSMVFLGWAVGAPLVGLLSDRMQKRKPPMVWGLFFSGVSIACVIYLSPMPVFLLYALLFCYGLFSSVEVIVFSIGRENSPMALAGTAVATTNMILMLSGVVLQPAVGGLLDLVWDGQHQQGLPTYSLEHFRVALSVLPLGIIIAMFLLLRVDETHARIK